MNYTESILQEEKQFSFSGLNKFSATIVADETIFRVRQRAGDLVSVMKHAVNNFLKTPEEMEAEFCSGTTSYFAALPEQNSRTGLYDNHSKKKDGHINIQDPEELFNLFGAMEENY